MMMRKISLVFALVLAFAGTACEKKTEAVSELDTKSEYSVLQSFEFDYRQRKQEQPYVVEKNALSSGYDLIGLPRKDSERGYVWLIANPSSAPAIKQMPNEANFSISEEAFAAIGKSSRLTPAVLSYLAAHVGP